MKVSINKNDVTEKDYNFIVSNLILSKEGKFTHNDCFEQLTTMFGEVDNTLKYALDNALIRLGNDGFINILGTTYSVSKLNL